MAKIRFVLLHVRSSGQEHARLRFLCIIRMLNVFFLSKLVVILQTSLVISNHNSCWVFLLSWCSSLYFPCCSCKWPRNVWIMQWIWAGCYCYILLLEMLKEFQNLQPLLRSKGRTMLHSFAYLCWVNSKIAFNYW